MGLLQQFLKRRAIKKYRRKLDPLLRKRYRRSDHYTSGQIRTTIGQCGFSVAYSCYALAMYLPRDEFDSFHQQTGESCDYDAMRQETGDLCFSGRTDFSVADCAYIDSPDAADGSDSGAGFDLDGGGGDGAD